VSVYATTIAAEMRLPEQQIEDVRAAALLHDIGKLEISRGILYKAARLDDGEAEEMKSHVDKGIKLLQPVGGSLRRVLPIILAHHDRFDGTGYHPSKGEEIPIEARIITVADAYDAMISDRPYRKAMTPIEGRDAILKGVGADFDPSVVKAFESAFRKQRMEVPEVLV
jgi:putative nucleotidyltransferase with HDIG domain